ncbi:sensor histidine kinase [Saccharomonospora xinjiangensis]|uniref:sensor histidine kinase n=1 Tax=Saccharomonospora xinjiangensis TaxID=75294 RepID=UPI00106F1721|nr:sensor histidine kinase [Saccharomonospora xinjiangensis]QBQ59031.1 Sensor histidine kinase LiaS [Saccharomonospora xinjiangensis]
MRPLSDFSSLTVVRGFLHSLVAVLLVLACVRAVTTGADGPAVVAVCAVFAAVYAAAGLRPLDVTSRRGAVTWLAALGAVWLALLILTPDAIWVAFPLFVLQLYLLPARWGVAAVALTTALAIGGFGWHQHALTSGMILGPLLGATVSVIGVLGYQALHRESERRRRLLDELTATRAELAAAERSAGVLAERERLAREIHDTVAQGLSSIQLLLRAAQRSLATGAPGAAGHIERARQAAADNLAEARRFVRDWSPPILEGRSLPDALDTLCATTADESGLLVNLHVSGTPFPLPTTAETTLWRVAQSALANVVRHAEAGTAEVTLSYMDTEVALDVVDDGVGFDPGAQPAPGTRKDGAGYGLAAMRARARAAGGDLVVESAPGRGTAVAVTLPCRGNADGVEAVAG